MGLGAFKVTTACAVLVLCVVVLAVVGLVGAAGAVPGRSFDVSVRAAGVVVRAGRPVVLSGVVAPGAPRERVELQELAGDRWRTVQTRLLSRSSRFRFAVRLAGVGGHFLRVVKPAGSGFVGGVSGVVEMVVPGRRSVRSTGGSLRLSLGAVHVSAPKGAITRGQTLTLSVGVSTGFGAEDGSSIAGGPYVLSTSQGEPRTPVTVVVGYDAALLASGEQPLLLHGWSKVHKWLPEPAVINTTSHTVTANLDSFSPLDVINDVTYYAGIVTGNRADLPSGCGGAPRWVDEVSLPDSNEDPLPICFSNSSNEAEAVLNMVNNRGYVQVVTISGAKVDVTKSLFADSLEGEVAKLFADLGSGGSSSTFILGPGDSATITIDRPPPQQAAQEVHIDQAAQVVSGVGELAWALLSTASDAVSVPVDRTDCIMTAVYNAASSGRGPSSAIDQMHSCIDAAASGTAKDVLQKLSYGLLVDDFFYKVIDLEGDSLYPPQTGFTIPGSNPTFTSPNIHISPLNLGTLPDGQTTTVQLTATGGTAPYLFYIWNEPINAAKVPSWVHLASDGTLTIEPPEGTNGEVSFAVYAFDANGDHSPFAREEVRFQTFSGNTGGGGGGGGTPGSGVLKRSIAAGGDYYGPDDSCAIGSGGSVQCWGFGVEGENPEGVFTGLPLEIAGFRGAIDLSTGGGESCAVLERGDVDCWGFLVGSPVEGLTPIEITNATSVSVGEESSCALTAIGGIDCWGSDGYGQLGDGMLYASSVKPVAVDGISGATSVSAGYQVACATLSDGAVDCLGEQQRRCAG
jgi:hypothetical protein